MVLGKPTCGTFSTKRHLVLVLRTIDVFFCFVPTLLESKHMLWKCFDQYLWIIKEANLFFCRGYWQQGEVADLMASAPNAVFHRPKLCQASLGEILHGLLLSVHFLDRHLLLLHGLDGECSLCGKRELNFRVRHLSGHLLVLLFLCLVLIWFVDE